LAQMAMRGTSGFSKALSAEKWGLYDVLFNGEPLKLPRELDSYVIDNILFKVSFPAEFHGQTAVEGALQLFDQVNLKWDKIKRIVLKTQEPAMRIIDKRGELHNPADRDHCLQYMVAAALTFGELKADHYSDHFARDPRIDKLRSLMEVHEYESFTEDYYDPNKRAIPNAIQIFFEDGTETEEIVTHYPIGHQKRREEALSLLEHKLHQSIMTHFPAEQFTRLLELYGDQKQLESMMVDDFLNLLVKR